MTATFGAWRATVPAGTVRSFPVEYAFVPHPDRHPHECAEAWADELARQFQTAVTLRHPDGTTSTHPPKQEAF